MKPFRWQPDTVATCTQTRAGDWLITTATGNHGVSKEAIPIRAKVKIHNGKARAV